MPAVDRGVDYEDDLRSGGGARPRGATAIAVSVDRDEEDSSASNSSYSVANNTGNKKYVHL